MSDVFDLRKRILSGERVLGTFYKTNSPITTEVLGYSGLDFIVIDCEHSAMGYESCENIIRVAKSVNLSTVVRVPCGIEEHVFHALDSGAAGVQIPNITSIAQAKEFAANARYFPLGCRGLSRATRAAKYGFWTGEQSYTDWTNENTLVVVHIENKEMAKMAEEICQIPQVDVLFVGPADMSQSLGIPGKATDPRVVEIATRVLETARKNGKGAGINVGNEAGMQRYLDAGANYITFGSDANMLASAAKKAVEAFRNHIAK